MLLLHPATALSSFTLPDTRAPFAKGEGSGLVVATIYTFAKPVGDDFVRFFETAVVRELKNAGATVKAMLASERSPNTFPALPVRENENVFVAVVTFANREAYDVHLKTLARSSEWQAISTRLRGYVETAPQTLRLVPTVRSLLQG